MEVNILKEFFLIVFRSRTQVLGFKKIINSEGINCEITNTPKEISMGCGLSLKIETNDINKVKKMCDLYKPQSFVGIYNVVYDGYKNIILSVL
jgi:hypothetical protein